MIYIISWTHCTLSTPTTPLLGLVKFSLSLNRWMNMYRIQKTEHQSKQRLMGEKDLQSLVLSLEREFRWKDKEGKGELVIPFPSFSIGKAASEYQSYSSLRDRDPLPYGIGIADFNTRPHFFFFGGSFWSYFPISFIWPQIPPLFVLWWHLLLFPIRVTKCWGAFSSIHFWVLLKFFEPPTPRLSLSYLF